MRRPARIAGCILAAALLAGLAAIHVSNHRVADRARAAIETAQAATPAPDAAPDEPAAALPALDALAASPLADLAPLPWWRRLSLNATPLEDLAAATAGLDRDAAAGRVPAPAGAADPGPHRPAGRRLGPRLRRAEGGAGHRRHRPAAGRADPAVGVDRLVADHRRIAMRQALVVQLDRALAAEPRLAPPLDMAVVERIRARLRDQPLSARAYAAIRTSDAAQSLPPFRADLVLGADSWAVRRRSGASLATPIPGLLTADGFHRVVVPALMDLSASLGSDDWVLGAAPSGGGDLTAVGAGALS